MAAIRISSEFSNLVEVEVLEAPEIIEVDLLEEQDLFEEALEDDNLATLVHLISGFEELVSNDHFQR